MMIFITQMAGASVHLLVSLL